MRLAQLERSGDGFHIRALLLAALLTVAGAALPAWANAALDSPQATSARMADGSRAGQSAAPAPCGRLRGFSCLVLRVPLDRSGAVAGSVDLHVVAQRTRRPPRGTLLALAGGPGQAALPLAGQIASALGPALQGYRVIAFDQRGTGRSGAIQCPALQAASQSALSVPPPGSIEACGAQLGPARAAYSTTASVEDIEAVRRALGVPRLAILGVSYGTYVAERYARRYPQNVDRLLLDSVVPQEGPGPFLAATIARIPAVLNLLCAQRACSLFLHDPVVALAGVIGRLHLGPLRAQVGAPGGRVSTVTMRDPEGLLDLLVSASQSPQLISRVPAALTSAARGDPAPLLRLYELAQGVGVKVPARVLSAGLNAATLCADTPMPWGRPDVAPANRAPALQAAAALLPLATLAPFDRATAAGNGLLQTCLRWPVTAVAPAPPPGPLPDVPTLLLSGALDLSTPVTDASREAARSPHGVLIQVPGGGHSILSNAPRCVLLAVAELFSNKRVLPHCLRQKPTFATAAPDPQSVHRIAPAGPLRGLAGRVLSAALGAVTDAVWVTQVAGQPSLAFGGLRGGRFSVRTTPAGGLRLRFQRDRYVDGVPVSGNLALNPALALLPGRLVIGGRSGGVLRIRASGFVDGRLAGRPVHVNLTTG